VNAETEQNVGFDALEKTFKELTAEQKNEFKCNI